MRYSFFAAAIFISIFAALPAAQAATLDGETVRIDRLFFDSETVRDTSGDVVVGSGVEYTWEFLDVDVSDTFFTVSVNVGNAIFAEVQAGPGPFNGFSLTDSLEGFGPFSSAVLTSTGLQAGTPIVSFDAESVFLNLSGAFFGPAPGSAFVGEIARVDFTIGDPTVIPLPAGGVLLVTGLGAFFGLRRRRTR